jgi:hypothetical protein
MTITKVQQQRDNADSKGTALRSARDEVMMASKHSSADACRQQKMDDRKKAREGHRIDPPASADSLFVFARFSIH